MRSQLNTLYPHARTVALCLVAVLVSFMVICVSFAVVSTPAHAAVARNCYIGTTNYCTTFFQSTSATATAQYGCTGQANLVDDDFTTMATCQTAPSTYSTFTYSFPALSTYLSGATAVRARVLTSYYLTNNGGCSNSTTSNASLDGLVIVLAAPPCSFGVYWSSWVAYNGTAANFVETFQEKGTGQYTYSYSGGSALQVEYQIPDPTVPGPTVTATATQIVNTTTTATATYYAYPSAIPSIAGTVAATLPVSVMAELRDINIDDTDARILSAPFVDDFLPAIAMAGALLVLLGTVGAVVAWSRRG